MTPTEQLYRALSEMPELRHKVGETFDMEKSEVIAWLLAQPTLKQWLFNKIAGSKRIVYDAEKGTWKGAPYREPFKGWKDWNAKHEVKNAGRPRRFNDDELLPLLTGKTARELAVLKNCSRTTIHTALTRLKEAGNATCDANGVWRAIAPRLAVEDVDA